MINERERKRIGNQREFIHKEEKKKKKRKRKDGKRT